jgi:hypothetical protein
MADEIKPPPWPYATVPAAIWRTVTLPATPEGKAASDEVLAKDTIGWPHVSTSGVKLQWHSNSKIAGSSFKIPASKAGEMVLVVGHIHSPAVYRAQPYLFRVTGPRGDVYVNGNLLSVKSSKDGVTISEWHTHKTRGGGLNRVVLKFAGGTTGQVKAELAEPGDIRFLSTIPANFDPARHVGDFKTVSITNGIVNAELAVPDNERGYYRGNRFEQAGIVLHLSSGGHTYFLEAKPPYAPLNSHASVGPAEEFFDAIAWDDAMVGEPFIKLGVGLFERPFDVISHAWYNNYWPLQQFSWSTKATANTVEFVQDVPPVRGWAYHYVKRVVLVPGKSIMRIEHELTNTGTHTINGEQYAHNWVTLDGMGPGRGYSATFPFKVTTDKDYSKVANIEGSLVRVIGTDTTNLKLFGWEPKASDNEAVIRCAGTPAAIKISHDFPLSAGTLFFNDTAICFEPFHAITVRPGETAKWTRQYEFLVETH